MAPSVTLERLEHDPAARALLDERDSLTDEVVIVPEPAASADGPRDTAPGHSATDGTQEPRDTAPGHRATDGTQEPRDTAPGHSATGATPESREAASGDAAAHVAGRTPRGSTDHAPGEQVTAPAALVGAGRASGWTESPVREATPDLDGFTRALVLGVESHRGAIEELITRYARRWAIPRMPVVDRNVLRLATYELLHEPTPPAVVIDEAIDLAKRLSTDDSGRFVNGVLESIRKEIAEARALPADDGDA